MSQDAGHRRLLALHHSSLALGRAAGESEVWQRALEAGERVLGADRAAILLPDPAGRLRFAASRGLSRELRTVAEGLPTGRHDQRSPCLEGNLGPPPAGGETPLRTALRGEGIAATAYHPLVDRGRLLGQLALFYDAPRSFREAELELAEALAEQIAAAARRSWREGQVRRDALMDPVTGLVSRALFRDRLELALARGRRQGSRLAVLLFDLAGLRHLNERHGHAVGDRLLRAVGHRMAGALRPADTVARLGGDEFAVLLEEVEDPAAAARVCQRLLKGLSRPFLLAGREIFTGARAGIALAEDCRESPDALLQEAAEGLDEARGEGAARPVFADRRVGRLVAEEEKREGELQQAVERRQLELLFEPRRAAAGGPLIALEALAGWQHPRRGRVEIDALRSWCCRSQLDLSVGRWTLTEACRCAAAWRRQLPRLRVGVCLFGRQLSQLDLIGVVGEALDSSGCDPHGLCLELEEAALAAAPASALDVLRGLKARGVGLELSSFGALHGGLMPLTTLPLDSVKLAPALCRLAAASERSNGPQPNGSQPNGLQPNGPQPTGRGGGAAERAAELVRCVVRLAHSLGQQVVASGALDAPAMARLAELGCDLVQGGAAGPTVPEGEVLGALTAASA